ncbi:MAG: S9 family peptidase [Chlamydiales bacterium]
MELNHIQELTVSHDGKQAAYDYVSASFEGDDNTFCKHLVISDLADSQKEILHIEGGSQPRWSPTKLQLAYLKDQNGQCELWLKTLNSQEMLFSSDSKIETILWSPNGEMIAFVEKGPSLISENTISKEFEKTLPFNQLKVIHPKTKTIETLTDDTLHVIGMGDFGLNSECLDWSPDSKEIVFTYTNDAGLESYHLHTQLAIIDLATKQMAFLTKQGYQECVPRFSPDGQSIACLQSERPSSYTYTRYLILKKRDGSDFILPCQTKERGPFIASASLLGWTKEGEHVIYYEPNGTRFRLVKIPIQEGEIEEISFGDLFIKQPHLNYSETISFVGELPHLPPEAYIGDIASGSVKKITHLNISFLNEKFPRTEKVRWRSQDGLEIEGLLTYPQHFVPGKRYPMLAIIHGGPMGAHFENFIGKMDIYPSSVLAQKGCFIFKPNPRGSCGYGKEFRCANIKDWAGRDFQDVMSGIDHLIAQGFVDREKLGIAGWSYGGYFTAAAVTKTDRFKRASAGAGLMNLVSMAGTSDIPCLFTTYFEGSFLDNPSLYHDQSPLFYVDQVNTPLLLQHGERDVRVPPTQSIEFYRALLSRQKDVKFLLYPKAFHSPVDPKTWMTVMQDNLDWFDTLFD